MIGASGERAAKYEREGNRLSGCRRRRPGLAIGFRLGEGGGVCCISYSGIRRIIWGMYCMCGWIDGWMDGAFDIV